MCMITKIAMVAIVAVVVFRIVFNISCGTIRLSPMTLSRDIAIMIKTIVVLPLLLLGRYSHSNTNLVVVIQNGSCTAMSLLLHRILLLLFLPMLTTLTRTSCFSSSTATTP